jgi:hypothetical protein
VTSALYTISGTVAWYNTSWAHRKTVTIDHTKVSGSASLANFALLFQATDANLKTISNGGSVGKIDGTDILFTASDGVTKLDHELEAYTPTTGQVTAWVRIPALSNSADTVIYIYYGNAAAPDQQNKTGVWDTNYKAVWHLPNGSTLSAADSTSNANGGTISGATAGTGLMDGGASFNGSSGYATIPSAAFTGFPTSGNISAYSATFSAWFKTSAAGVILGQDSGEQPPTSPGGYVPAVYIDSTGHLRASLFWHGSGSLQETSSGIYNDGAWHHVTVTFNNGTEALYVDGTLAGSQTGLTENGYNASYKYFLGTMYSSFWPSAASGWSYFNGIMDEMRVSNAARSSDWVLTEYRNQNAPATFFSEGPQQ